MWRSSIKTPWRSSAKGAEPITSKDSFLFDTRVPFHSDLSVVMNLFDFAWEFYEGDDWSKVSIYICAQRVFIPINLWLLSMLPSLVFFISQNQSIYANKSFNWREWSKNTSHPDNPLKLWVMIMAFKSTLNRVAHCRHIGTQCDHV